MFTIEDISYSDFVKRSEIQKPPIKNLKVGQSVFVSDEQMSNTYARVYSYRHSDLNKKFKTKVVEGGTRIFRVK